LTQIEERQSSTELQHSKDLALTCLSAGLHL